ncbi:MAG: nitrous oxide reductase accessory protein NosL [Balneolaceae bacterium]
MAIKKIILVLGLLLLTSCVSREPAELNLHSDECAYCIMVVSDDQFASQLVTSKGKSYMFDSVECLAAYSMKNPDQIQNGNLYVSDYQNPGNWLSIKNADFYVSEDIKSPMGLSLFAIQKSEDPANFANEYEELSWAQVQELVKEKWNDKLH